MGRNYGDRYLRQQQSQYNVARTTIRRFDTEGRSDPSGPPEGFKEVILEWLDEHLPPIIKRSTGFNKHSTSNFVTLSTDPNYVVIDSPWRSSYHGRIAFRSEVVEVTCHDTGLHATIEYAHPQLFELLQTSLSKFFNGVA